MQRISPIRPTALDALGIKAGTDKSSLAHDYLRFYESRLAYLREQEFCLLEIGVFKGASLATWLEYFPRAIIVAIEYEPTAVKYARDRCIIEIGDAGHADFLRSVMKKYSPVTVVIDDASHRWDHQIVGLQTLFPMLEPGGHYIVEDIDTSFEGQVQAMPYYRGESKVSGFEYVSELNRVMVAHTAIGSQKPADGFIAEWAPKVDTIEFYRRTVMINKRL